LKTSRERRLAVLSATTFETRPLLSLEPAAASTTAWPVIGDGTVAGVPVVFAVSGLGKSAAAAAVAALARGWGVGAVVQVGVGGAYPGAGIQVGSVAFAATETDLDLGVGRHPDWRDLEALAVPGVASGNVIDLRGAALAAATTAADLPALPFGTSDSVTADPQHARYLRDRFGVAVESMEGAGAARAAAALGVAFVEVRGVSNVVGDRDRSLWRLEEAIAAAGEAALRALPAVMEVV